MPPDEVPVTKILDVSAPYFWIVYLIMLDRTWVSPPPSWVRDLADATSQQLKSFVVLGKMVMKPYCSDKVLYLVCWAYPGPLPPQP